VLFSLTMRRAVFMPDASEAQQLEKLRAQMQLADVLFAAAIDVDQDRPSSPHSNSTESQAKQASDAQGARRVDAIQAMERARQIAQQLDERLAGNAESAAMAILRARCLQEWQAIEVQITCQTPCGVIASFDTLQALDHKGNVCS
jgi:hypothetical protein